jgi:S1-C subfamily serine protease
MVNNSKAPIMNIKSTHEIHKFFALLVSFLFLTALPSIVSAQTAQEIARKAFGSTVLLVMEDANGQPLSLGSGFFVREGEIASNLHVVEGASRGYAKLVGQKTKYDIEGITAIDPGRDLVVLKISGARASTLALGSSDAVQVGETVYAVGNPQGLEGTFSQGIISSIREVGTDKLLQITAPISPGSSGGPVLNGKGEVIGVSVATFRGGQNLNFAIPSKYLKELLAKSTSLKPLAQAKAMKTQKSILSDLGGRGSEGVMGGQLTWEYAAAQIGRYAFSLRNQLRDNVRNVYCLVVFYDSQGGPIDVDIVEYRGVIPAGLAKRVTSQVDGSVQKLTTPYGSMTPKTKIEFRVLDFQIVN